MKKRVPAMRFKGFGGDWVEKQISEIFKITRGNVLAAKELSSTKNDKTPYPVFSSQTLNNGLMGYYKDYLFEDAITWTTDGANAGTVRFRPGKFYSTNVNGVLLSDCGFANQTVAEILDQVAWKFVSHVGNPKLMNNTMGIIKITIPNTIAEQEKIGAFFRELDRLLCLKQKKLESLQKLKAAMLSRLFPVGKAKRPELRFEGFGGDWEERRLGEVGEIIGGGTPSTQNKEYWDGTIDWYSPTEIGDNVFAEGSVKKITEAGLESSSARLLPAGKTVLFTSRASIGDMAILKKAGATNQGFQSIVLNEAYNPYFIYSMGFLIKKYAIKNASGSTFLEISGKALSNMPVKFPSLAEQEKIGAFFRGLDELIGLESRSIRKLQGVKKGLLGGMFV